MANIHSRTFIVLMLISVITLGKVHQADTSNDLLSTRITHHIKQDGVLSQTFDEDLIFNYTDSFSESTLLFSCYNLNLTSYNELTINFFIEGDQSSKAGIAVSFFIGNSQIDYLIEKHHQQSSSYSLSHGFYFDSPAVDDFDITATFAGQALSGKSGSLTILANSSFTNLDTVDLTEAEQTLVVSPDILLFDGNMFGLREISTFTLFNNSFNSSYALELTVEFLANDFQCFTNTLIVLLNGSEVDRSSFSEDSINEIDFQFEMNQGFNPIDLVFQVEVCSDLIELSNISVKIRAVENTISADIFKQITWTDGIDETVNLSSFKPSSTSNEHFLNISLYGSFEGSLVIDGIEYDMFLGTEKIASGIIGIGQQNGDIQIIEVITFTDNYQEDLLLKLYSDDTGSGVITIYNSSLIEIGNIPHVDTLKYTKYLEEEITFSTPVYGAVIKEYVDIIYIENTTLPFQFEYLMELSSPDTNFQSITLSLYINDRVITTKSISDLGDVHIVLDLTLSEGFNKFEFSLNILGRGATLTFENMRYSVKQGINDSSNPLVPQDEFNIPFFKVPKNIFLGIFVLFDCWLVMGIMMRIYKGRKKRKIRQVENDEYILEIVQLYQD